MKGSILSKTIPPVLWIKWHSTGWILRWPRLQSITVACMGCCTTMPCGIPPPTPIMGCCMPIPIGCCGGYPWFIPMGYCGGYPWFIAMPGLPIPPMFGCIIGCCMFGCIIGCCIPIPMPGLPMFCCPIYSKEITYLKSRVVSSAPPYEYQQVSPFALPGVLPYGVFAIAHQCSPAPSVWNP